MDKLMDIRSIACDDIVDPDCYRQDLGDLDGLKESIEALGLLQPILVSEADTTGYVLLAGRRRLAAFRSLDRKEIQAVVVPVESSQPIEIQCDENACRKRLTSMEAVSIARRLRPLVQAAALKRREMGVKSEEETGKTRDIVAHRVGLSHVTLKRAEYVLDQRDKIWQQRDEANQTGTASVEIEAIASQLHALVERMSSSDKHIRISIGSAYRAARALIEGEAPDDEALEGGEEPNRVVRIPTTFLTQNGIQMSGEVLVSLSVDDDQPPNELIVAALNQAIVTLTHAA